MPQVDIDRVGAHQQEAGLGQKFASPRWIWLPTVTPCGQRCAQLSWPLLRSCAAQARPHRTWWRGLLRMHRTTTAKVFKEMRVEIPTDTPTRRSSPRYGFSRKSPVSGSHRSPVSVSDSASFESISQRAQMIAVGQSDVLSQNRPPSHAHGARKLQRGIRAPTLWLKRARK